MNFKIVLLIIYSAVPSIVIWGAYYDLLPVIFLLPHYFPGQMFGELYPFGNAMGNVSLRVEYQRISYLTFGTAIYGLAGWYFGGNIDKRYPDINKKILHGFLYLLYVVLLLNLIAFMLTGLKIIRVES